MTIKAVLFDMDGVLIDADRWHYNALNLALQVAPVDPISWTEHLTIYKGIPTRKKLSILKERKGLEETYFADVNRLKQEVTVDIINRFCMPDPEKVEMMRLLKERGLRIGVCSNAIRNTVRLMLEKSGLIPFVDFFLSNEDVTNAKPDPEIYLKAFEYLNLSPSECVIVEDSDVGKQAARRSNGVLCSVDDPSQVNFYRVLCTVLQDSTPNVVIPAAGQGKRFSEVGYQHPKPLINVKGEPMLCLVLENFASLGHNHILMQKKHLDTYCAAEVINHYYPNTCFIPVDGLTEGAACTVLLARDHINNQNELILANSDQYVDCNLHEFVNYCRDNNLDGGILTFKDSNPKWSFALCEEGSNKVIKVAEKDPISDDATVGIYYFRHGEYFVKYADQMMAKDIRVNNEFYVCPVFNELIEAGLTVHKFEIPKTAMHGLGTPEDLEVFLNVKA